MSCGQITLNIEIFGQPTATIAHKWGLVLLGAAVWILSLTKFLQNYNHTVLSKFNSYMYMVTHMYLAIFVSLAWNCYKSKAQAPPKIKALWTAYRLDLETTQMSIFRWSLDNDCDSAKQLTGSNNIAWTCKVVNHKCKIRTPHPSVILSSTTIKWSRSGYCGTTCHYTACLLMSDNTEPTTCSLPNQPGREISNSFRAIPLKNSTSHETSI